VRAGGDTGGGYRPAANEPGHHQTMIQSLTLGVSNDVWVVLDALRRQRNANDYTGQPITPAAVAECLAQAKALNETLLAHLRAKHADLLAALDGSPAQKRAGASEKPRFPLRDDGMIHRDCPRLRGDRLPQLTYLLFGFGRRCAPLRYGPSPSLPDAGKAARRSDGQSHEPCSPAK